MGITSSTLDEGKRETDITVLLTLDDDVERKTRVGKVKVRLRVKGF